MKVEVVKKKVLKVKPNLTNYERTYKKFDWDIVRKEIEFFPKNKLNAAYNVIDRHANSWRKNKVALYW